MKRAIEHLFISRQNQALNCEISSNQVYSETTAQIARYYFSRCIEIYDVLASYSIATYQFPIFDIFPILVIIGQRATGKTTLGKVLEYLCWNPIGGISSLREAPLFRVIEASKPTIIVDATKMPLHTDLLDVFENGWEKGKGVLRCVGEDYIPMLFDVYCPKIAVLREQPTFVSKAINIISEAPPRNLLKVYQQRRTYMDMDPAWMKLRVDILNLCLQLQNTIQETYRRLEPDDKLWGRRFDVWRPILAVAKAVGGSEAYNRVYSYALMESQMISVEDRLANIEDATLKVLLREGMKTFELKWLTEQVKLELGDDKVSWQMVKSAVTNLGIVKKYHSGYPAKYTVDLERIKRKAEERGIQSEQQTEQTQLD